MSPCSCFRWSRPSSATNGSASSSSSSSTTYSAGRRTPGTRPSRARAYNAGVDGIPLLDPWLSNGVERSPAYLAYLRVLGDTEVMATVRVPAIGVALPLRHGSGEQVLAHGLGHLYGTALPVGGAGTHAVVTGHTGMTSATMLDRLVEVTPGQEIFVDVSGQTLAYRVDRISVVRPDEAERLRPVAGEDHLTLLTCTPYGTNSHRLLVRGVRVPYDATRDPGSRPDAGATLAPWMWWLLLPALAAIVATVLLVIVERTSRRRREVL